MITREVLLAMVNGKVDTTKFKSLSQKTINEELDDVLEDLGDDEEANGKIVTKLANRLKRMDGNVHKSVSDEMKKNKEAEEERKRLEEEERQHLERERGKNKPSEDSKYDELLAEIKAMKEANAARDKKAAKDATIESIKEGLKEKFKGANLDVNPFFLKTALGRLEIPEENADVRELVGKLEVLYNEDTKAAGWVPNSSKPNAGGGGGGNGEIGEHEFDDIKEMVARSRPKKAE